MIGLYIFYVAPVLLRRLRPDFEVGAVEPGQPERAGRLDGDLVGRGARKWFTVPRQTVTEQPAGEKAPEPEPTPQ